MIKLFAPFFRRYPAPAVVCDIKGHGQLLLPLVELLETSRMAVDELIDSWVGPVLKRSCKCRLRGWPGRSTRAARAAT